MPGLGVYSAVDAARMIGMTAVTLRRWLQGYDHHEKFERPLWLPQYEVSDDGLYLGFRDLIEARVVYALRRRGFGLPTIRTCIDRARALVGDDRPFSTRLFKTDGKSIFVQIAGNLGEPDLVDLKRRQGVFHRVVEPSLEDLEFGESGAERWWLLHGKKTVVADPAIAFGAPIVAGTAMTTARVAQAVKAEGSVDRVSRVYEIGPRQIRDALAYENQLHTRKAA
jgi:uncharacterized protein (DUF433 family)